MVPAISKAHFAQPLSSFSLCLTTAFTSQVQGHGDVFKCRELRQQVMKLPHIPDLTVAELGSSLF